MYLVFYLWLDIFIRLVDTFLNIFQIDPLEYLPTMSYNHKVNSKLMS